MNLTDAQRKRRDELANKCAYRKGNAHGLRDQPAWYYSLLDFKEGFDAGLSEAQVLVSALADAEMMLRGSIRFAEMNRSDDQSRYVRDLNSAHNKVSLALANFRGEK